MEPFYPLHARVCEQCLLVQLQPVQDPQSFFNDRYAYFSSFSDSWLAHARDYAAAMIRRFGLGPAHRVVEVASNDGYLLQYFREAGIPVLGIDPARTAPRPLPPRAFPPKSASSAPETARALAPAYSADLMAANNVLAHVPDINDFVEGFRILLKPEGVATFEFPTC
jgi:2-polyprenyl-3-methyl-5-hydroxy-6-metoxy-1,4-benzoquinol methylase